MSAEDLSALQKEIADLTSRLTIADANNVKAGELGLKLIEEKSQIEAQYDQLQRDYDSIKSELDLKKKELLNHEASH
jgi:hypothetical protein